MRIIAGELRGRRLLPPQGPATRPITDRVKQSLFDILGPNLPGAVIYDCFAGTGSMGLESLSRGAERAVFFEFDPGSAALLRRNIETLGLASRSRIVTADIFTWADSTPLPTRPVDILFFDPPYRFLTERPDDLQTLAEKIVSALLSPTGRIIFRHDRRDVLEFPMLRRVDLRDYGSMRVEFLEKEIRNSKFE